MAAALYRIRLGNLFYPQGGSGCVQKPDHLYSTGLPHVLLCKFGEPVEKKKKQECIYIDKIVGRNFSALDTLILC